MEQSIASVHFHTSNSNGGEGLSASSTALQPDVIPYETVVIGTPAASRVYAVLQNTSRYDNNEITLIDNTLYEASDVKPVEHGDYEIPANVSSLY